MGAEGSKVMGPRGGASHPDLGLGEGILEEVVPELIPTGGFLGGRPRLFVSV